MLRIRRWAGVSGFPTTWVAYRIRCRNLGVSFGAWAADGAWKLWAADGFLNCEIAGRQGPRANEFQARRLEWPIRGNMSMDKL